MVSFVVRRAKASDYDQIVDLQLRNMGDNLTEEQRRDGFLSGYFDAEMLAAANENLAVVVCADGDRIAGFVCLTTPRFTRQNEVATAMMEKLKEETIFGKQFDEWNACLYGPVCIEREYRGVGLFERLYKGLPQFSEQCNLLVCLVAVGNQRSIAAHSKVGMTIVSEFEWSGRKFVIMAESMNKLTS